MTEPRWRIESCDAGMGETEYRLFWFGDFFAQTPTEREAQNIILWNEVFREGKEYQSERDNQSDDCIWMTPEEEERRIRKHERDKVLNTLKTEIIKDLIVCSFEVPDYPYVRKECISLYDAYENVKQKIGVELRQAGSP